ncbi:fungal-specific transcription factor domain-containing protein [Mycena olivaceomarginata]|nr:fungal-specific transcription factor domain-containing protein [Mycena olivaceomarginata]
MAVMSIRAINERERECEKGDFAHMELVDALEKLETDTHKDSYLGQSSGVTLLKTAVDLKAQYTASDSQLQRPPGSRGRRSEYWTAASWVTEVNTPQYTFPPPDLLSALVDLYFEHNSVYIPLLHRPTFERALADDLHLRDDKFGANVLIVYAITSSFSDDPRKYFTQVTLELEIYATPTLYDLQRYCLALQFLEGSPLPQGTWALVGVGIRMAQEVGAHRRQIRPHTVEAELWRRAFWVLVAFDRMVSCGVGRACAMQYENFDIQMATQCDDEYWEHKDPARAFCQPPGKPSRVAFFNSYLRLSNILAFVLHLLYSLDKTRNLFAMEDHAWEERIVVELDSALNKWADGMPAHRALLNQSVALYCAYYHVQMITHRPFIPTVREMPTVRL